MHLHNLNRILAIQSLIKCDRLSKNPTSLHNFKNYFLFTHHYLQCPRNGSPKFQPSVVCSFEITALESRKNKEIDLYSDYTKNKLQVLTLAAITSVWISLQSWKLAYYVHNGLTDQPRCSFSLAGTCA